MKQVRQLRQLRVLAGLLIWLGLGAAAYAWLHSRQHGLDAPRVGGDLWRYAAGQRQVVAWETGADLDLSVGDPVFVMLGPDSIRQVGEVSVCRAARRPEEFSSAPLRNGQIVLYASAPAVPPGSRLTYHETPHDMRWIIETMLPPEKRRRIGEELQAALDQHQDEILAALRPVVEATLRDALPVVEQELAAALERHRPELEQLGGTYQREIVERELIPLVKQEVWPVVLKHAEPAATEVGREIWQQASLWRFGWRYAYDLSPLPEKRLTEREWQRFVREEAAPILNSHTDDFVQVQQRILADLAANPRVQATLRESLGRMLGDPQLQAIVGEIFREVLVDNPRVAQVIRRRWESEQTQRAVRLAASRLEPTAVRIGQLLLGTPEEGITPEFAQVLRNRILAKDRRWLILEPGAESTVGGRTAGGAALRVTRGSAGPLNPFVPRSAAMAGP